MTLIAGAVLAAGSGVRMGRPKADLVVDGTRLLDRALGALRDGGCTPLLAVVRDGTQVTGARAIVNPYPARGLRSSLELAVAAAGDAEALAVVLVDTPGVTGQAVATVVAAWRPGRITVARYADRRGHPTVMAPRDWQAALAVAAADEGARDYLAAHPDRVDEIPVSGDPADLDTREDLARYRNRSG